MKATLTPVVVRQDITLTLSLEEARHLAAILNVTPLLGSAAVLEYSLNTASRKEVEETAHALWAVLNSLLESLE